MAKRVFTQTFGVAGAIIERDGKILLVKEAGSGHAVKNADAGKWNIPAGWIEVGENPLDTVKKEVKEESGYDFTPTAIIGIYSLVKDNIRQLTGEMPHPIKIVYTGTINGEQGPLTDDITEAKWFSKDQIDAMDENTLRDVDIKQKIAAYFSGIRYPLSLITHTIQT